MSGGESWFYLMRVCEDCLTCCNKTGRMVALEVKMHQPGMENKRKRGTKQTKTCFIVLFLNQCCKKEKEAHKFQLEIEKARDKNSIFLETDEHI